MKTEIKNDFEFTRASGGRLIVHFLALLTSKDQEQMNWNIDAQYSEALRRAAKIGGRKFHNKQYRGGIAFYSYDGEALREKIISLRDNSKLPPSYHPLYNVFTRISELKAANKRNGCFFFSKNTMRFFKSKIETRILCGRFFITSESYDNSQTRQFTVREIASKEGDIINDPLNKKFPTLKDAKQALKNYL